MKRLFKGYKLVLKDGVADGLDLLVVDGHIAQIARDISPMQDCEVSQGDGLFLSPGFIDIHVHGGGGSDFMDGDADAYIAIAEFHRRHGTTTLYPTLLGGVEVARDAEEALAEAVKRTAVHMPGFHFEGPFLNPVQAGAIDPKNIREIDEDYYLRLFSEGPSVKRMTVAPELEGSERLVRAMLERGVVPSIGHTDATCAQIVQAFDEGCRLMTHFYSAMSLMRRINAYRVAGAVEAGYLLDDIFVEIIADGSHLPGDLLRLICKVKKKDRVILVTDANRAAGQPEGGMVFLGAHGKGSPAIIEDGVAKLPDRSAFAGSIATANRLLQTLRRETNLPLHEIVAMATINPATAMGIAAQTGSLEAGKAADLIVFDENIHVTETYIRGQGLFI